MKISRSLSISAFIFLLLILTAGVNKITCQIASGTPEIKHRFATVDIRRNQAMILSEDNEIEWKYKMEVPTDIQVLQNGNVLVAGINDVAEVNSLGDVIWEYHSDGDLFSAVSLKNGNYLIGCSAEFQLKEVDRNNNEKLIISTATDNKSGHMHSRHIRKFTDGTYWVALCADASVNSYNGEGEILKSISVRRLAKEYGLTNIEKQQAYSVEELANGHVLISAGFPAFVAEADRDGNLIWGLSAQDVPEVNFIFSGGTQRLSNGNTVICNWTGHNSSEDYIPVFEVNREKEIVWTFSDKEKLPEPLGIFILEE